MSLCHVDNFIKKDLTLSYILRIFLMSRSALFVQIDNIGADYRKKDEKRLDSYGILCVN